MSARTAGATRAARQAAARHEAAVLRILAAAGPWPAGRVARAALALAVAALLAALPLGVDPRVAPLLALPAFAGIGVLAAALALGRAGWLGAAVVLLGVPAAAVVADASVASAAAAGAGLVAVLELSRWSVERRVGPPAAGAAEIRRWVHLAGVVGCGWLAGAAVVTVGAGQVRLAAWHVLLGALAAVTLAATVALLGRTRA